MVNELIGLQLITVIWKPETGNELIGLKLITVIWNELNE